MARLCTVCGRGALKSQTRSHSHIATIRHQELNLQTLRLGQRRVRACTSCVRTETKRQQRAASVPQVVAAR